MVSNTGKNIVSSSLVVSPPMNKRPILQNDKLKGNITK